MSVVIFANVEKKFVIVPLFEKKLVLVALVVVLFSTVRPMKLARDAVRLEKNPLVLLKLVIVPVAAVRLEIVVVASVEVPRTTCRPVVVELPLPSTRKLRFSVQARPFQYSVDDVAVPLARSPVILFQEVDVPFVVRTWPGAPVALFVSRNSPVSTSFAIVVLARYERPEAVKLVVEAF
jgi:hypothetical protein